MDASSTPAMTSCISTNNPASTTTTTNSGISVGGGATPMRTRMANRSRRFGILSPMHAGGGSLTGSSVGGGGGSGAGLSVGAMSSSKPFAENCLTSMKQRIVSYFFKEALANNSLSQFYLNLDNIIKLKMYKMQLLDDR